MKKHIFYIVAIALTLKIFYFAFALTISKFDLGYQIKCNTTEFFSLFKRGDSFWYEKVTELGYPKITNPIDLGVCDGKDFRQSVWAHFPVYPLLIKGIETVFKLNFNQSAFIISLIFSSTSFIGFYLICINIFKSNERKSFLSTMFFMFFPFHYYYSMYYTEATFFTFLAFSFLSINKKKYWITSLLLIPLTLVRPNGIACLLPLFIYYIEVEGGFLNFYLKIKTFNWQKIKPVFWFFSAPLALGFYCVYQEHMTGFYFAFVKAQAGWGKKFMFPFLALFRQGDFPSQFNSIYTFLFMLLSVIMVKKIPFSLNVFIWISILLPLASGSVACMPRYISVIFPFIFFMASFAVSNKKATLIFPIIILLHFFTFYLWITSHPLSWG